jgi:hypothetical protein
MVFIDFCSGPRKSKHIVEMTLTFMTRYDVLNNDNLVKKFKCRNAPIKRSF